MAKNFDWEKCKDIFEVDGSLRDIYIRHTTLDDWQKVLDAIRESPYPSVFSGAGESALFPQEANNCFDEFGGLLQIQVGEVQLNCHFFIKDEIEFDLDNRNSSKMSSKLRMCFNSCN